MLEIIGIFFWIIMGMAIFLDILRTGIDDIDLSDDLKWVVRKLLIIGWACLLIKIGSILATFE